MLSRQVLENKSCTYTTMEGNRITTAGTGTKSGSVTIPTDPAGTPDLQVLNHRVGLLEHNLRDNVNSFAESESILHHRIRELEVSEKSLLQKVEEFTANSVLHYPNMQQRQRLDERLHALREEVRSLSQEKERGEHVWTQRLHRCQAQLRAKEEEMGRQSKYFERFKSQLQQKLDLARDREQGLLTRVHQLERQVLELTGSEANNITRVNKACLNTATAANVIALMVPTSAKHRTDADSERLPNPREEGEGEEEDGEEKTLWRHHAQQLQQKQGEVDGEIEADRPGAGAKQRDFILSLQEDLQGRLKREEQWMVERQELMVQLQEAQENGHFLSCEVEEMRTLVRKQKLTESSLTEEVEELQEENQRLCQRLSCTLREINHNPGSADPVPRCASTQSPVSMAPSLDNRTSIPPALDQDIPCTVDKVDPVKLTSGQSSRDTPILSHQNGTVQMSQEGARLPQMDLPNLSGNLDGKPSLLASGTRGSSVPGEMSRGNWCPSTQGFPALSLAEGTSEETEALREAYLDMVGDSLREHGDPLEGAVPHTLDEHTQLKRKLRDLGETGQGSLPTDRKSMTGNVQENRVTTQNRIPTGSYEPNATSTQDDLSLYTLTQDELVLALNQENRALGRRIQELVAHLESLEEQSEQEHDQLRQKVLLLEEQSSSLEQEHQEQGGLITELTRKTEDDLNTIMELQQRLTKSVQRDLKQDDQGLTIQSECHQPSEHAVTSKYTKQGQHTLGFMNCLQGDLTPGSGTSVELQVDHTVSSVCGQQGDRLTSDSMGSLKEERDELNESLRGLKEEREQVALSVSSQTEEKHQLTRSLWLLKEERDQVTQLLCALKLEKEQLTRSLCGLKDETDKMKQSLCGFKEERDKLAQSLPGFQEERDQLVQSLSGLKDERDQLVQSLSGLQEERDQLVQSLSGLQEERDTLSQYLCTQNIERDQLKKERDQLMKSVCTLKEQKEQLAQTLRCLEQERDKLSSFPPQKDISALKEEREQLVQSMDVLREQREQLMEERDLLQMDIAALRNQKLLEGQSHHQTSSGNNTGMTTHIEGVSSERRGPVPNTDGDVTRNGPATVHSNKTVDLRPSAQDQFRDKRTDVESEHLVKEMELLEEELRRSREELENTKSEVQMCSRELGVSVERREDAEKKAFQTANELTRLREENKAVEELERENHTLRAEVEEVKSRLAGLKRQMADTHSLRIKMEEQLSLLQAELKAKSVALTELSSEYTSLKRKHGSREDWSKTVLSLKARYDDIRTKYNVLLRQRSQTDLGVAPLKAKLSVLVRKCQQRNSVLVQLMQALRQYGHLDYRLTQEAEDLLNDLALQDYLSTFTPAATQQEPTGIKPAAAALLGCTEISSAACASQPLFPAGESVQVTGGRDGSGMDHSRITGESSLVPGPLDERVEPLIISPSSPDRCASPSRKLTSPEKIINLHQQLHNMFSNSYQVLHFKSIPQVTFRPLLGLGYSPEYPNPTPTDTTQPEHITRATNPTTTELTRTTRGGAMFGTPDQPAHASTTSTYTTTTTTVLSSAKPHPSATSATSRTTSPVKTPPTTNAWFVKAPTSPVSVNTNPINPGPLAISPKNKAPTKMTAITTALTSSLPPFGERCVKKSLSRFQPELAKSTTLARTRTKPEHPAEVRSVEVIRTVGQRSLMIGWERPLLDEMGCSNGTFVFGYRIYVDGEFHKSVMSSACTKCILENLDLSGPVHISVQTLGSNGLYAEKVDLIYKGNQANFGIDQNPFIMDHMCVNTAAAPPTDSPSPDCWTPPTHGHRAFTQPFVAIYNYTPLRDSPNLHPGQELALTEGDAVMLLGNPRSDGFCEAEVNGRRGLAPLALLESSCSRPPCRPRSS
ncbi:hypothetical protein DPEC_G00025150 [Dallia pectoralis]|uniref:Uncharacterized protein n=1 Tax=Dallia pectoralis TaxID=75939 RepID=A0ACC2HHW9_DALPE|nr:hypothetical protein DPEC_G00025150 [Dallia pectoralis]